MDEPFDALAPRASAGEERACFLGREEWTETTFTLPKTVSREDMKVVAELAYIIREGKSSMSFEQITLELDAESYQPFQQGVPGPLRLDLPLAVELFGKTLHLGHLVGELPASDVKVAAATPVSASEPATWLVRLEPATADAAHPTFRFRREPVEPRQGDGAA